MVSPYRAAHHLRNGGLHKALNVGPDSIFSPEHVKTGSESTNAHVAAMADLVRREHEASKAAATEGDISTETA